MQRLKEGTPGLRALRGACLFAILAFGLYLRMGTATQTVVDHPVRNDAKDYVAYAWNLKFHGVYSRNVSGLLGSNVTPRPDDARTPGYPWMLRLLIHRQLGGSFIVGTKRLQAWIAEATLLCSTLLAMELLGGWGGLALGFLVAISPHQSIYVAYLLTETLYGLLLMLALATGVLTLKVRAPRWRLALSILTGVLFGVTCLVRPTLNQWVFVLVLLLVWPPMRRFRREILVMAGGFVLAMSPWWARNLSTFHQLSDPAQMRISVQQGSYPGFMYHGLPQSYGYPYRFDPNAAKAEASWGGVFSDLRAKFASEPGAMLRWYMFGKVEKFFGWSPPDGWHGMFTYPVLRSPWLSNRIFVAVTSIMQAMYVPLIICGVLGTLVAWLPWTTLLFGAVRTDVMRFLALLHLYAIGVHVVAAPFARYSVPFRPLTFLLALFFMVWLAQGYLTLRSRRAAPVSRAGGIDS